MCSGAVEFARAALDGFSFTLPVLPGTLFGKILANGRGSYAKGPGQLSGAGTPRCSLTMASAFSFVSTLGRPSVFPLFLACRTPAWIL